MFICTKCKKELAKTEFNYYNSKSRGIRRRSNCKECEKIRHKEWANSHRERKRAVMAKSVAKKKATGGDIALKLYLYSRLGGYKKTAKALNLPFDIDVNFLIELFHKQEGKCYYTNELMIYFHNQGKPQKNSISLDRKNPNDGYTKENVVFCTWLANNTKNMHTELEFYEYCKTILKIKEERN